MGCSWIRLRPTEEPIGQIETGGKECVDESGAIQQGVQDDCMSLTSSLRSGGSQMSLKCLESASSRYQVRLDLRSDDLISNVPTISESIADMSELAFGTPASKPFDAESRITPANSGADWASEMSLKDFNFGPTPPVMIDSRPHPFAPNSAQSSRCSMRCSDEASTRDDMSVVSSATDAAWSIVPARRNTASRTSDSEVTARARSRLQSRLMKSLTVSSETGSSSPAPSLPPAV
eukprot:TRINITY_DN46441_c0_g1_i1.p1 TRINITY_DN46441_c0_g1~~TRINITY_DN46441_c0_g1_i1.p1  ORF type:complete len:234 (-),score=38.39 TRINITY_DN46441_c0_g1_i1:359-1060(-)